MLWRSNGDNYMDALIFFTDKEHFQLPKVDSIEVDSDFFILYFDDCLRGVVDKKSVTAIFLKP